MSKRLHKTTYGALEPGKWFVFPSPHTVEGDAKVSFIMSTLGTRTKGGIPVPPDHEDALPWAMGNGATGPFRPGDDAKVWAIR